MIWVPVVAHYYVPTPEISTEVITQHRSAPSPKRLDEITDRPLFIPLRVPDNALQAKSARLLAGELSLDRFPAVHLELPFAASNLDVGLPTVQLQIGSLVTGEIFLRAYEESGNTAFLRAAEAEVVNFAKVERSAWVPRGFLWNDHSVAARIWVLVRFWRHYRESPLFQTETALRMLQLVARSAEMLAEPSHYTFRTNHGIMQDVGLLQLAAAFPNLARVDTYRRIACERLSSHLKYYVGPDGVVLEHSAAYHLHGTYLLETAILLAEMNGCAIPNAWRDRLLEARQFLRLLVRPDGSLPVYGNTDAGAAIDYNIPQVKQLLDGKDKVPRGSKIFPVSGYAVWWNSPPALSGEFVLNQTVVAWSFFPGHGHKLADEMSVNIWANGRSWITNTGYWPYGVTGRLETNSWRGSNAPHFVGEPERSQRSTQLLWHANADRFRIVDLERTLKPGKTRLRRQVLQVGSHTWAVLDVVADAQAVGVDRVWTGSPALKATPLGKNSVLLEADGTTTAMRLAFTSNRDISVEEFRGRMDLFGGWVVVDGIPRAAHAFQVRQPAADGWVLTTFEVGERSEFRARPMPKMDRYDSPERWSLLVPDGDTWLRLTRRDPNLSLESESTRTSVQHVALVAPENPHTSREEIRAALEEMAAKFPQFRDLLDYRILISKLMLIALVLQELTLLIILKLRPAWVTPIRLASSVGWLAGGGWIAFVYLQA